MNVCKDGSYIYGGCLEVYTVSYGKKIAEVNKTPVIVKFSINYLSDSIRAKIRRIRLKSASYLSIMNRAISVALPYKSTYPEH